MCAPLFAVLVCATAAAASSTVDDLVQLTQLHTAGALTDGEFTAAKQKVLMMDAAGNGAPSSSPSRTTQDFVFEVRHYMSSRQSGKCLNIIVKYRYIPGAGNSTYIDYLARLRPIVLRYAEPTAALPEITYWELVNKAMVQEMMGTYADITGISSQFQVMNDLGSKQVEPSNHGSIVTMGDPTLAAVAEPLTNAFPASMDDCTKHGR